MIFIGFLFVYSFLTYGLSNLLVNGMGPFNCLHKLRALCHKYVPVIGEMLECMMCTSTNIGWVFSLINLCLFPAVTFTPFNLLFNNFTNYWYLIIIFDALYTTGIVWVIHSFQEMCEKIANYFANTNEDE